MYIKKKKEKEMLHAQVKGGATRCECRRNPTRPIVSSALTVVMMYGAAGPLLSLKLYEASLAHILLQ